MKVQLRLYAVSIFFLLFTASCAQIVQETVSPVEPRPATGRFSRIAILPFADYTPSFSPYDYWRRNTMVLEALQDEFYAEGYIPTVQEDVVRYLFQRGVIRDPYETTPTATRLDEELQADWSPEMKEELVAVFAKALAENKPPGRYGENQELIAVDNRFIREIGQTFGVDYVVRGRIVEFRAGEEDSFNPLKTGILPFVFKGSSRAIYGVARSEKYEELQWMSIGGALGALLAPSDWPIDDDKSTKTSTTFTGAPGTGSVTRTTEVDQDEYKGWNRVIWAAAGVGAAALAHKGGKVPDATVQVRALVHDARTGEVIWISRAEARTVPQSAFAEQHSYMLFAKSIQQVASSLVDNFVMTLGAEMEPAAAVAPTPKEAMADAAEAERAAAEAEESAHEAKQAAQEAKQAAGQAEVSAVTAREAEQEAKEASSKSEKIFDKMTKK